MKIPLNKIAQFLKKSVEFSAENAFLIALLLALIASMMGGLIFYKYGILIQKKETAIAEHPLFLNRENLQEVLDNLSRREIKFQEADSKEYQNSFIPQP